MDEVEFLEGPHLYRLNGKVFPSVTEIPKPFLGDRFRFVPEDRLEDARERGKLVHRAAHDLDIGELDVDGWRDFDRGRAEPILPYVESYRMWRDATGFVPTECEKVVFDSALGVAGTLDRKGYLFGSVAIIDLKSGVVGKETALQTAGYAILDKSVTAKRYALQLVPGKMAKLTEFTDPLDIVAFRAFVTAYNWVVRNGFYKAA
jgi:hypothetical protein